MNDSKDDDLFDACIIACVLKNWPSRLIFLNDITAIIKVSADGNI